MDSDDDERIVPIGQRRNRNFPSIIEVNILENMQIHLGGVNSGVVIIVILFFFVVYWSNKSNQSYDIPNY